MVRARFREGMDKPSLIEPGKIYAYDIDCWTTSQVFKKGHSIRLEIASTAFPKYDRNPNTGDIAGQVNRDETGRSNDLPRQGSPVASAAAGGAAEGMISNAHSDLLPPERAA